MRTAKAALMLIVMVLGALSAGLAHGQHVRFGIVVGVPFPWYYPAPYYYYPPAYYPPAVVAPTSPTYVERSSAPPAPPAGHWYYCADAKAYYPYVKQCPGGWQRVAAGPPPGQPVR